MVFRAMSTCFLNYTKQLSFLIIVDNQVYPVDAGQLLACPLGVTACNDYQGIRITAVGLSQPVARLTIGGMGHGTGVEDIDISLTDTGNKFISSPDKLSHEEFSLRLI
jgi:hypothetical protein